MSPGEVAKKQATVCDGPATARPMPGSFKKADVLPRAWGVEFVNLVWKS